jgi:signal transduction histidine kinase
MADIVMTTVKVLSLVLNAIVLTKCLPRRKPLPVIIVGWAALALICFTFERVFSILPEFTALGSSVFIPFVLWAYKGKIFQMMFAMLLPMFSTVSQQMFVESILRVILPYGTNAYWITFLIAVLALSAVYLYLVFRFGKRFYEKLFMLGRTSEWAIYAVSSLLSFFAMTAFYTYLINDYTLVFLLTLCTITWSYILLCFAIINTHEKTRQKYDADLAREIISSGRGYYDKLTDLTEKLHIMRHDYKYHLASMQKMIKSGNSKEVQDYLETLNENIDEKTINDFCESRVVNSVLDSFSERCKKDRIEFQAKIILPPAGTIDDYELCIIISNLLENALTACLRTPENERRYIDLSMRPKEQQYGVKVENSFDGVLKHEGKTLHTTKKDGGLGIKSIVSVARRYNGEYVPVWDERKFSAFVVIKIKEVGTE